MIEEVSEGDFIQRFALMDRKENFSYEGRKALYEYLTDLEEDTGEQISFDCIAICCEYDEYEDLDELNKAYDEEFKNLEEVGEQTQVIEIPNSERFIIVNY